ncbi:MAG: MFS transporter [Solobacterium sp.]|nr:MFS transporter [Solobacterium sp.]
MKRPTILYSLLQSFFWSVWAALFGFSSTYLLAAGLSSFRIGIVMGVCSLVSAVLQPVLAGWMDRTAHRYLKTGIVLFSLVSIAVCFVMLFWQVIPGILFGLCAGLLQMMAPLVNALAADNPDTDFGISRGIGSLGYAVVFPLIGIFTARWKADAAVAAAAAGFAGTILMTCLFPVTRTAANTVSSGPQDSSSFVRRYRSFMLVLAGVLLLYISHVFLGNYGYQIVQHKGGDSVAYGNGGSIAALFELPTMFLFARLLRFRPASFWVRITGISFFLKALTIFLAHGMGGYYAAMAFQLSGWGMIQVASVYYVNEVIAPEDTVRGQSLFTSALALATVIGSFAGGWLLDRFSVPALTGIAALLAAVGAVIVFLCMRTDHDHQQRPAD